MREESELRQRVGQKLKLCPEQYLPIVEGAIDGALKIEKPNEENGGCLNILCFSYFAGIFGLLQRFISRDKIRYHGASAFPEGSRLPHGTVPACSKHRTGTARHSHCGGSYPSFFLCHRPAECYSIFNSMLPVKLSYSIPI